MTKEKHKKQSGGLLKALRTNSARTLLLGTFFLVILLYALVISIATINLRHVNLQMKTITEEHIVRADLISQMYTAARERSLLLYSMAGTADPFQRDQYYLQFNNMGAQFADARRQLLEMALTAEERKLIEKQGIQSSKAVPVQRDIVELLQEDKLEQATDTLISLSIPLQNEVLKYLHQLQELERQLAYKAAKGAENQQSRASALMILLGVIATLLTIGLAIYVIKRISLIKQTLQIERDRAEVTLHSIGDAVITTDIFGHITYMNPIAEHLTGWDRESALGQPLNSAMRLLYEDSRMPAPNPAEEVLVQHFILTSRHNLILLNQDGSEYAIEHTVAPIMDDSHEIHGAVVIFRDVSEMRHLTYKLNYNASHDFLTGLVNRREFEVRLGQALDNTRAEEESYSLCYIDLDQFKIINDTAGHTAGDELLKQVSRLMSQRLRRSDVLARLGGDEFGILLEGCDIEKATTIAESVRQSIADMQFVWDKKPFATGASIGVVPISSESGQVSDLMKAADTACYEAKERGRNRVHIYDPSDKDIVRRRGEMEWAQRLALSLEKQDFTVFIQDIKPLDNISPVIREVLVRLIDEKGRIIPPMAFIPAAERYNVMSNVDKWVLQHTLQTVQKHYSISKDWHFSINISGQSLCDPDFANFVMNELRNTDFNCEQICFEITETAAIANLSLASEFIYDLKEFGCKFALDDFGSGLSSFTYLKSLPVDYLKIDGSFIRDITKDTVNHAFVESISKIGRMMEIKTIAEFVEDAETLERIKNIGIDYAQGNYINKPASLTEVIKSTISAA